MQRRIGIIVGDEHELARQLVERCGTQPGVEAELVRIGGTAERQPVRYDVILDRASQLVPCYRSYLCAAALAGATVIPDPFFEADRFVVLSLASRAGLAVPRTVLLPQHAYGRAVDPARMLGNLEFPLRWHEIVDYVKLPALLRPVRGAGEARVASLDELWRAFDASGEGVVMLQEQLPEQQRLRCLCFGRERALVVGSLAPELEARVAKTALTVARALGHDLCAVELAAHGDELCVVDCDPRPPLEAHALDPLVDALVAAAWGPPAATRTRHGWR